MRLIRPFVRLAAARRLTRLRRMAEDPQPVQREEMVRLIGAARATAFGREHGLHSVRSYEDYRDAVPLREYAGLAPWWDRARHGEPDVTWPGYVRYWAISSGTTAGEKYLPVSEDTIRGNKKGGLDALVPFLADGGDLFGGKLLFLGGSTDLRKEGPSWVGDNTGIMTRRIPRVLRRWHTPGQGVAGIGDWDEKIRRAAEIAIRQDVRMLSGLPSWIVLFAERALAMAWGQGREVSTLKEIWPELGLYVTGGTSFAPYRRRFLELAGGAVRCTDTYSASEGGQLAVQDREDDPGMLPLMDQGVFFEFVPPQDVGSDRPTRVPLHRVEKDRPYAVVLNTDSGIYGYLVGDVVRFTSVRPYRLVFEGRLAHTLNAFGEHVSGGELDRAMLGASEATGARVKEYAVTPRYPDPTSPVGAHRWFVEFVETPSNPRAFAEAIDRRIQAGNEDYATHRKDDFGLLPPEVVPVPPGAFYEWMRIRGKVGGQNKVPRVLQPELAATLESLLPTPDEDAEGRRG